MSRTTCIAGILILCLSGSAQSFDPWVNDDIDRRLWQSTFHTKEDQAHRAIRSYSLRSGEQIDSSAYRHELSSLLSVSPVLGLEGQFSSAISSRSSSVSGIAAAGVRWHYRPLNTLTLNTDLLGVYAHEEANTLLRSSKVIPGIGRGSGDGDGLALFQPLFDLDFHPSEKFSLAVGKGKHFFGPGYRSFILSDHASPYPYARIDANVWHLHYMSLFSKQKGVLDIFNSPDAHESKYTATHLLSWNISPQIDLQIFETIIWQAQDSLSNRGFDVNYLNPIIFYRPVEFATGSADNAIVGIGMSFKLRPTYEFYIQSGLDEFLLNELKSGNGWWANKFGAQFGIKGYDVLGIEGLYAQAEFNLARPFTYSHGSPLQSYTHLNEPLAHPLGANFYEGVLIAVYKWGRFELRDQVMYEQVGLDGEGGNLGGNIFRSYASPEKQYGNFIGQGDRFESVSNSIWFSYILEEASDFRLQIGHTYRSDFGRALNDNRHFVTLSARMNFRDAYR